MRRSSICLALATAGVLLLAAPAAWGQEADRPEDNEAERADVLVEPAPGASTSPGGSWFQLDVEPGVETRQELALINTEDRPVELALAAVDADTGPTGGASYRRLGQPVEATGAWIALDRDRVRLEPGETATVGFTVAVPAEAASGEHLAGIAVWAPGDVEESEDTPGAVVAVQQRRVVAVQMTLPGIAEPLLRVTGVEPQAGPGGVRLLVGIAHEGTALTDGRGVIEVGEPAFEQSFEFGTFVPGTAIAYSVEWLDGRPPEGVYQARVTLEYGMWTETWEGAFTVGEAITAELERLDVGGPAIPWRWVAAAVAMSVFCAGCAFYLRMQRPRQRPSRRPATWSTPRSSASQPR